MRSVDAAAGHPLRAGQRAAVQHFHIEEVRGKEERVMRKSWDSFCPFGPWIVTAEKTSDSRLLTPLSQKPVLVLTEDNDAQEKVFFGDVPVGGGS